MNETNRTPEVNLIGRFLIWLSGSDPEVLKKECPKWEKIKYEAIGASVLVPVSFGMIAASYAISTLTSNLFIIVGFAIVWGFIIMTIDRVLLATYRAFVPFSRKVIQFVLRITVAVLMGLTVSHPLTLLLFKDTIASEIEKQRTREMAEVREESAAAKQNLEERIQQATLNLQEQQLKYQETVAGNFLNAGANAEPVQTREGARLDAQFADIDEQIREYKAERDSIQAELSRWQKVYDDEISGERSGRAGIGPEARAIERDEIAWRREAVQAVNSQIADLTARRTQMSTQLMQQSAAANAEIAARRQALEKQKIDMFASQQGQLLEVIKGQIDSASAELDRLREDAKQLSNNTRERIDSLKVEKRADLMTQTMVLHHLFEDPKNGGRFALAVYIVIAGLFTLIDTIPLVVKFMAVPGVYDVQLGLNEGHAISLYNDSSSDFSRINQLETKVLKQRDSYQRVRTYTPEESQPREQPGEVTVLGIETVEQDSPNDDTPQEQSDHKTETTNKHTAPLPLETSVAPESLAEKETANGTRNGTHNTPPTNGTNGRRNTPPPNGHQVELHRDDLSAEEIAARPILGSVLRDNRPVSENNGRHQSAPVEQPDKEQPIETAGQKKGIIDPSKMKPVKQMDPSAESPKPIVRPGSKTGVVAPKTETIVPAPQPQVQQQIIKPAQPEPGQPQNKDVSRVNRQSRVTQSKVALPTALANGKKQAQPTPPAPSQQDGKPEPANTAVPTPAPAPVTPVTAEQKPGKLVQPQLQQPTPMAQDLLDEPGMNEAGFGATVLNPNMGDALVEKSPEQVRKEQTGEGGVSLKPTIGKNS